jgi:hypothetical protein
MRPFEILVAVATFLSFVVFAVPRLRAIRWTGSIVFIALVVAVIQVLVERARWQMVPAYVLTGLFLMVWGVQHLASAGGIVKRILTQRVVAGATVILCLLDMGLSATLPTVLPIFHFLPPSGPYQIGTVTYHWVDTSRHELFSQNPRARRELMAQIWYPVKGDTSSDRAPYVPDASALSSALARGLHLPGFIFDYFQEVPTHAIPSAPVANAQPTYPVLIFLSGITGYRQSNTFQEEELVSHGYIVVGLDQPYAAATVMLPDGRQIIGTRDQMQPLIQQSLSLGASVPKVNGQALPHGIIPYFTQDVSFTLDQLTAIDKADPNGLLTGRLDLQRVGIYGTSLGAIIASEACHRDTRLEACLMMDAAMPADVVQAGLRQPSMWMTRPASDMQLEHWSEADIVQTLSTMQAVFNKESRGNGYYVSIPGMFHINFTDGPYFTPLGPLLSPPLAGPINAQRGFDIINAYSLAFFDRYVEGRPAALLDGPSKQYPEVLFSVGSPALSVIKDVVK